MVREMSLILDEFLKFKLKIAITDEKSASSCPSEPSVLNAGQWMTRALRQSGIASQGTEAHHIHGEMFRLVFCQQHSRSQEDHSGPKTNSDCSSVYDEAAAISSSDYFDILCQRELGWASYFEELLPMLHLDMAVTVLTTLQQFVSTHADQLSLTPLIVTSVSSVLSLLLDFVPGQLELTQETALLDVPSDDTKICELSSEITLLPDPKVQRTLQNIKSLSVCLEAGLKQLMTHLKEPALCQSLIEANNPRFERVCQLMLISCLILDPEVSHTEVRNMLAQSLVRKEGLAQALCLFGKEGKEEKKKQKERKGKKEEGSDMVDVYFPSCGPEVMSSREISTYGQQGHQWSSVGQLVMSTFRSRLSQVVFYELLTCFSQGSIEETPSFYKPLINVLLSDSFTLGHHCLQSEKIVPSLMTRLVQVSNKQQGEPPLSIFQSTLGKHAPGIPAELADFRRLRMNNVEKLLEEGRPLSSEQDLQLLKIAVEGKERGWLDLLCLGLKTKSLDLWWSKGFYELVWSNEDVLSSQVNVTHVLDVLVIALTTGDDQWITKMYRLFTVMFRRLPFELQEQLVLQEIKEQGLQLSQTGGSRADHLSQLMSREQVATELTPMINKLTTSHVPKLLGELLWLSLFSLNTVLQHLVQAAVENKGQIIPVLQVLQSCPALCRLPSPDQTNGTKTQISDAVCHVLSGSCLTEKQRKNLVVFLTSLVQSYGLGTRSEFGKNLERKTTQEVTTQEVTTQEVTTQEVTTQEVTTQEVTTQQEAYQKSVLDVSELFEVILEPSLNSLALDSKVSLAGEVNLCPLTTDTTLDLVLALMDSNLSGPDLIQLHPVCLSVCLTDLYVQHLDLWTDGEIDKTKVKVRQGSLKCLSALVKVMAKHKELIQDSEFAWLASTGAMSSYLHLAILWPALPVCWDVSVKEAIDSLVETTVGAVSTDKGGLACISNLSVLILVASVNVKCCCYICEVLVQTQVNVSWDVLTGVLRQAYKTGLPTEVALSVQCIQTLVRSSPAWPTLVGPSDKSAAFLHKDITDDSSRLTVVTSGLLKKALLGLLRWEMSESSMAHLLYNYQAAVQAILPFQCCDAATLCHVMWDILETLTFISDPDLAQILQVTVLQLFTQLETVIKEERAERKEWTKKKKTQTGAGDRENEGGMNNERQKGGGDGNSLERKNEEEKKEERCDEKDGMSERELSVEEMERKMKAWRNKDESLMNTLTMYISCVVEHGVRAVLEKKMEELWGRRLEH